MFAQLMNQEQPTLNEADSFGQAQEKQKEESRKNDVIPEAREEDDDDLERRAGSSDEMEEELEEDDAKSELFSVSNQNVPEIEASTGTFGEKSPLHDQLKRLHQPSSEKPRIFSAIPKKVPVPHSSNKKEKDDKQSVAANANRNRPFSGISKGSIPVRSAMDTSETKTLTDGSSLARDDEDNSADYEKDSRIEQAKLQNEREIDK